MTDLIYDELHDEKVRLAAAVLRVCRLRYDFQAKIMQGHQDLAKRYTDQDPLVSSTYLSIALDGALQNPKDKSYDGARLQLIDAMLHVWYRVEPDLQSRVMTAVKEVAMLNDEDESQALQSAYTVLQGSRSAGAALTEQKQAHEARAAKRRAKTEDTEVAKMRKRLRDEAAGYL